MITTLTLNPAFDIHVNIGEFRVGRENLADTVTRDVGGKGINISRALLQNGIQSKAIVAVGRENGDDFKRGLSCVGLECEFIECAGRIRENITVHPDSGAETRLSFKGFSCDGSLLEKTARLIDANGILTFTGSVPDGISVQSVEDFLMRLRELGTKLVIDSKSVSLDMLRKIKPWLIKPNAEECEAYFGKMTGRELYKTALRLHSDGIENVMVSLGGDGAILASEGKLYRAKVPKTAPVSTIGAGDSAIAGFIACDGDAAECLRLAVAYGTAACLREGTNPPLKNDIERIYSEISVEEVKI